MAPVVSRIVDRVECEKAWTHLCEEGIHPGLNHVRSLPRYEEWKTYLERGVGSFWTLQGERPALFVAYEERESVGLVRALRVPIYPWDRDQWGRNGFRGEIQDLLCNAKNQEAGPLLVKAAVSLLKENGLERIGGSCWRPEQCEVLTGLGFKPYHRNILLAWRTDHEVQVEPKLVCKVEYVKPGEERLVQEVFTSTWGIPVTFLPHMEFQQPLVAIADGKPVGTVLMNTQSGSIDLGVQVVSSCRRKHLGSLLIQEALRYYRRREFDHMFLVRNLPVNGLRVEDDVALQFYASTGAFPLREYVGFRMEGD